MSTIPAEAETSYTPGPGQSLTAPKRGRGEMCEQQPGMRAPICGACDAHIRFSQIFEWCAIRLLYLLRINPELIWFSYT